MSPSHAEMIPADASEVTPAGATHVGPAKTTDVGSAEATHVTSTKAAHVAAAATMSAAAATASGLRTRGNKAAGKQRRYQNRHPSSLHDHSPLKCAGVPPQHLRQPRARLDRANADVAIAWKMGILVCGPY
jgi:hypothetical protein